MNNYKEELENILQQNIRMLDIDLGADFYTYDIVEDIDKLRKDLINLISTSHEGKIDGSDL